jgi:predicted RNase H-like HicB family nuclease
MYRWEPEGFWAESPEAPGFTAVGATLEEVRQLAREGLEFHFQEPVDLDEVFLRPDSPWSFSAAGGYAMTSAPGRLVAWATHAIGPGASVTTPAKSAKSTVHAGLAHAAHA